MKQSVGKCKHFNFQNLCVICGYVFFCIKILWHGVHSVYLSLQIWCAAGVNISMGRTKDGGSVVGASVFYADSKQSEGKKSPTSEVEKLDQVCCEHHLDMSVRYGAFIY